MSECKCIRVERIKNGIEITAAFPCQCDKKERNMARKVFTYKDVEEAKKYIGKPGRFSENLYLLQEDPDGEPVGVLTHIGIDGFPFATQDHECYQFFSPDPEPVEKWVPFTAEDWELFMGKVVRHKAYGDGGLLVFGFGGGRLSVAGQKPTFAEFLGDYTFMDNSPCGKKILTESTE